MKYLDVITMMNGNIMGVSACTLPVGSAYAVTKFKCEVNRIFKEYMDKSDALVGEAGIQNAEAFDERRRQLTSQLQGGALNNDETKELDELNGKMKRLDDLRAKLSDDTVQLNCKPIQYEDWYLLKNENKELKFGGASLLDMIETVLENILWKAPENE